MLDQVESRGDSDIVYDPACEFVKQFYNPHRGDIVLKPLDARMPYWNPSKELRRKAEAKALAVSLYQPEGVAADFGHQAMLWSAPRGSNNTIGRSPPIQSIVSGNA